MKIEKKLEKLLHYYLETRQVGHTTLMKEGINHYDKDFFVLTMNMQHGDAIELNPKNIISWENLDKLQGHNRPLTIDNGTMIELLIDAMMRIEALEEENKKLLKDKKKIYITKNDKT